MKTFCISAQYVNVPDPIFRNVLKNSYGLSSCFSGTMLDTTCSQLPTISNLYLYDLNIQSLEGISYLDNLLSLDCTHNPITRFPRLPKFLQTLKCADNHLDTLRYLPQSLRTLECIGNHMVYLEIPDSLENLTCWTNNLVRLPPLPNSLLNLDCNYNSLDSLPPLPPNLVSFNCGSNQIKTMPGLPSSLKTFSCYQNKLTDLPPLPQNLTHLECYNNKIDSLPQLPLTLVTLNCYGNKLTHLPSLPSGMLDLDFGYNLMPTFPDSLPPNLRSFDCSYNLLTSLPPVPGSILDLGCGGLNLTLLPPLPPLLRQFSCDGNKFVHLPALPNSIESLDCSDNLLVDLPDLSSIYLGSLDIRNNPNLTCLPKFGEIQYCQFSNTGITCVFDNYDPNGYNDEGLMSLPKCDPFNPQQCYFYYEINGRVFHEQNSNCIKDSTEAGIKNIKINLFNGTNLVWQSTTDTQGNFHLKAGTGNYTFSIDTTNSPVTTVCPASGKNTITITNTHSTFSDQNFGVACDGGYDARVLAIVSDAGNFRPANFATLKIKAGDASNQYGLHCMNGVGGSVKVILSGPVHYFSSASSMTPQVNGDTLTYIINNFGIVNFDADFRIKVQIDTSAQIGNLICVQASVEISSNDVNHGNNALSQCFAILNSFDPNDKAVSPDGAIEALQEKLTYTIRFQNTGNADAQHIYVLDSLDSDLDVSSFELLAFSHQPQVEINGNIVRFNFPNINLADSLSDEAHSHGYIQYSIKPKRNLSPGTKINNTAFIYFDFNTGVKTNTVQNWIKLPKRISTGVGLSPRIPIKLIKN